MEYIVFLILIFANSKKYTHNINTKENDESRYRSENFREIRT